MSTPHPPERRDLQLKHWTKLYLALLDLPEGEVRLANQAGLCMARDQIARLTGETAEAVQDRFEDYRIRLTRCRYRVKQTQQQLVFLMLGREGLFQASPSRTQLGMHVMQLKQALESERLLLQEIYDGNWLALSPAVDPSERMTACPC